MDVGRYLDKLIFHATEARRQYKEGNWPDSTLHLAETARTAAYLEQMQGLTSTAGEMVINT